MRVRVWWVDASERWQSAPFLLPEGAAVAYAQGRRSARAIALEIVEGDDPNQPAMDEDGIVWWGGHRAFPLDFDQSRR